MQPLHSDDFTPDSYLMHVRTNRCDSCHYVEQWSELSLVSIHKPTRTRRLSPAPNRDLPLAIGLTHTPVRPIPFCSRCVTRQPIGTIDSGPQADQRWRETIARKYAVPTTPPLYVAKTTPPIAIHKAELRPQAAAQPSRRITATLDQL